MKNERVTLPPSEVETTPVDISDRVRALFGCKDTREQIQLRRSLKGDFKDTPVLTLTLDYTTLGQARWVKAWIEYGGNDEQKRKAAIRATESQMKEAANVFASGVEWIQVEE